MKTILVVLLFSLCAQAIWQTPEAVYGICDVASCTSEMKRIYNGFHSDKNAPKFIPGMYSGVCYHQSSWLDPETTHYVGLLIDHHEKGFYMAPVMQFFGEENSMKDWTLEYARSQSSPDWKKYGPMTIHPTSAVQTVLDSDGMPVYIYWARQNLETKSIWFLSMARGRGFAFCEAKPNKGGLL